MARFVHNIFHNIFGLLRPEQWYKNLVVFLALIFSGNLLNSDLLIKALIAFAVLCGISSVNYIINDIADFNSDRNNVDKKSRLIASGKISRRAAMTTAIILLLISLAVASVLSVYFFYAAAFLFVFSQIYTFYLKKEAFADILAIGINFIVRAVAGALVINVWISPWLVLGPFFLSVFMSTGKRYSELHYSKRHYLGKRAINHRIVFKIYSLTLLNSLLIISTTCLIISYSLYSFLSQQNLLASIPFAIYIILRYFHLIHSGSETARMPQKIFKDSRIMVGLGLWLISVLIAIY